MDQGSSSTYFLTPLRFDSPLSAIFSRFSSCRPWSIFKALPENFLSFFPIIIRVYPPRNSPTMTPPPISPYTISCSPSLFPLPLLTLPSSTVTPPLRRQSTMTTDPVCQFQDRLTSALQQRTLTTPPTANSSGISSPGEPLSAPHRHDHDIQGAHTHAHGDGAWTPEVSPTCILERRPDEIGWGRRGERRRRRRRRTREG